MCVLLCFFFFFFFNDTATTEIYTLSLHDALPILVPSASNVGTRPNVMFLYRVPSNRKSTPERDRKSTRLNSSHGYISYAVFCLKKKKNRYTTSSWATHHRRTYAPHSRAAASHR